MPKILDNAETSTSHSEKSKHTQSSICFIKKWEGRVGEIAWIFLTDKFHQPYPEHGNYEREAYDVILQYSSIKAVAWFVNQEISGKSECINFSGEFARPVNIPE